MNATHVAKVVRPSSVAELTAVMRDLSTSHRPLAVGGGRHAMGGQQFLCCELEPAVYGASSEFARVNHTPEKNPDFRILFDDGRGHLQGTREQYDLILSEPSNPWLAGVASLFTSEFYAICRGRLGERGLLAQWIQLYSFSEAEYAMVIRTLTRAFRHACLIRVSASDTILLASDSPILPDRATIDRSQKLVDAVPAIRADLKQHLGGEDVRSVLFPRLILDEAGLRRLAARSSSTTVNTDLNLRLEFDAPLRLFSSDLNPDVDMDGLIVGSAGSAWLKRMIQDWGSTPGHSAALRSLASLLDRHEADVAAADVLDLALAVDAAHPGLRADRVLVIRGRPAEDLVSCAAGILDQSPDDALRIGQELFRRSKYAAAVEVYRGILARHPGSASTWECLGSALELLKDWPQAREAYRKAFELDPLNPTVRKSLENFEKREKK